MGPSKKHEVGSSSMPSSSNDRDWERICLKRRKVKQALAQFKDRHEELFSKYTSSRLIKKARLKALVEAAKDMKEEHQWVNSLQRVGPVPGVEVGDRFEYWNELVVIGLHHQYCNGIDYIGKGQNSLATSIVATDKKDNVVRSSGRLEYLGCGGNPSERNNNLPYDQKLVRGNLALKNSMHARCPVRVVLGITEKSDGMQKMRKSVLKLSYVYDGLYLVEEMRPGRGITGTLVFWFTLKKVPNQPNCGTLRMQGRLASFASQRKHKSECQKVVRKQIIRINDLSEGKEKLPIRVVMPTNCFELPPSFDYIVNMVYLKKFNQSNLRGCDCSDACVDCKNCPCIVKNGGMMLYDSKRRLVSSMKSSFIYECGPSCKCSSSCGNQVSQCGIRFQLEIFKKFVGWGVRTLSYIPSGSFVCELIGVVHLNREVGSRPNVDDYIFNIGNGNCCIDATKRGNFARFIKHHCSPNLCVKNVVYDQTGNSPPHKMLFALKDIPAYRELSCDYNSLKENIKFESKQPLLWLTGKQ